MQKQNLCDLFASTSSPKTFFLFHSILFLGGAGVGDCPTPCPLAGAPMIVTDIHFHAR